MSARLSGFLKGVCGFVFLCALYGLVEYINAGPLKSVKWLPSYACTMVFWVAAGALINHIGARASKRRRQFSAYYFILFALCIAIIVLMFRFNAYLPALLAGHTAFLASMLALYAGACLRNCLAAG